MFQRLRVLDNRKTTWHIETFWKRKARGTHAHQTKSSDGVNTRRQTAPLVKHSDAHQRGTAKHAQRGMAKHMIAKHTQDA